MRSVKRRKTALPQKLSAIYSTDNLLLASLMQDRMNLVCKAYIASNTDDEGVLILSDMAGASRGPQDAIFVNLNNISAVSLAIKEVMFMDEEALPHRSYTIRVWAFPYAG